MTIEVPAQLHRDRRAVALLIVIGGSQLAARERLEQIDRFQAPVGTGEKGPRIVAPWQKGRP